MEKEEKFKTSNEKIADAIVEKVGEIWSINPNTQAVEIIVTNGTPEGSNAIAVSKTPVQPDFKNIVDLLSAKDISSNIRVKDGVVVVTARPSFNEVG